ncbi:hypothetical protein [Nitrosophilus alvini]|uniref:hypothetical protein n=1 Tax=Nitrosophilus alvini TaxID=2714855 RepID=UPI00190C617A|nr:hypothetical protein [Nitrosophilus alvini]
MENIKNSNSLPPVEKIEDFKKIFLSLAKEKEYIETACSHLQQAAQESEKAAENILKCTNETLTLLNSIEKNLQNTHTDRENSEDIEKMKNNLTRILSEAQFQDIFAQRLLKIDSFLKRLEKLIDETGTQIGISEKDVDTKSKEFIKSKEEFAWENEVEQKDVDDILKEFGI